MQRRTIKLGKWSITSYRRSDRCEIVHVPISFNVLDDEQKRDLLFVLNSPNRSNKIRECIRMVRTQRLPQLVEMDISDDIDSDIVTDDDVLNSLI